MSLINRPLAIGSTTLPTRLVLPPMATHQSSIDGRANEAMAEHYAARALAGGFGLIETEHHYVSAEGRAGASQTSAARDDDIGYLALTARAVHAADVPVILQISHAGAKAPADIIASTPLAPSALPHSMGPRDNEAPRAMTRADIRRVIADFAAAARRAMEAGYDGVEVHAAHGYLLNQFYSPLTNHRQDAYGGSAEARARLAVEITSAVRTEVGPEAVVSVRLGACDYAPGGATIDDAVIAARLLEEAGANLISISGGMNGYMRPDVRTPGWFSDASLAARRAVSIPVLLTGGVKTGADAEALLEAGVCDLVGVGRPALRDPDWAREAVDGLRA